MRERRGDGIGQMVAGDARKVEDLRAPRFGENAGRPADQIAPPLVADQREDQVAVRVDVVHGDQQLAEAGLAEVLRQHLRVAAAELGGRRLLQLRRAADQIPHHAPGVVDRRRCDDSGARIDAPPERAARGAASDAAIQPSTSAIAAAAPSTQQHQPRQPRRQRLRRERGLRQAEVLADEARRAAGADHAQHEIDRKDDEAERHGRDRHRHDRQRQRQRPDDHARHRTPAVERPHRGRAPEPLVVPEPLRAVDRREQRADDADAAAGDDVDLDAGFVERAQHAGVIGAGRAGAGQDERGAALR